MLLLFRSLGKFNVYEVMMGFKLIMGCFICCT
nr:MAG TPA: hypothetical protein [Caudoviricetes sp.]